MTPSARAAPLMALLAAVFVILASAGPAAAHDSTDGSIVAIVDDHRVIVTAPVAFAELGYVDTSGDGLLDADELTAQEAAVAASLVDTARGHAALTVDGEAVEIIGAGVPSLERDPDRRRRRGVAVRDARARHGPARRRRQRSRTRLELRQPAGHRRAVVPRRGRHRATRGRRHDRLLDRRMVECRLVLRSRHRAHPVRARPPAVPGRAHPGGRRDDGHQVHRAADRQAGHRVHARPRDQPRPRLLRA